MKSGGSSQVASAVTSQTISVPMIHATRTVDADAGGRDQHRDEERDEGREEADAAEERVGVPTGDLEQPGREDALQHREDHDGEERRPTSRSSAR